jgi:hypothetical protein
MDEMTMLQDFRSAVAPPDPGKLGEARTRVARAARPDPAGRPPRKLRRAGRARAANWPRLAISGAVAVCAAAAVIVAVGFPSGGRVPSRPGLPQAQAPRISLDVLLRRAAAAAAAQPEPHGDQYAYSDVVTYSPTYSRPGKLVSGHITGNLQEWQSVNGSHPNTYRATPCVVDGDTADAVPGTCTFTGSASPQTPGGSTYAELEAIPTAPGALVSYLTRDGDLVQRYGRDAAQWYSIVVILQDNPAVPPRLSAALFEAARKIPGIALLGNIASPSGARGVAVARATPWTGLRTELIFDPQTYRFAGYQDVTLGATDGLAAGSVWDATALRTVKVANNAPGDCQVSGSATICSSPVSSG